MSSNPPAAISAKIISSAKATNSTSQVSPSYVQGTSFAGDTAGTRRSLGREAVPRNNQASKKQHKQSKRPNLRLADEDAFAESVGIATPWSPEYGCLTVYQAAMHPTSRKGQTSITHLMQFALPPRPQTHVHSRFGHGRNARRNPTWGLGSGYHAVDKARYVHANYRFLVDPRADYRAQSVDADVHLDWNNVLQILVSAQSQAAACPICLGEPVAPRMAKCGHIFCLPCLIRYMHSEDSGNPPPERRARWKKCPICWDSIYVSETRPVRWYLGEEGVAPREGADVVLRLVRRQAGSTLAMPRDSSDALGKGEDVPWYFAAEVMDYARIMKGSEEYMLTQLDSYIADIEKLEHEDELMFNEDTEWTRRAIRMLIEAKEKTKGIGNPPAMPKKPEESKPRRPPIQFNETDDGVPEMYAIQHAARSGQSFSTAPIPLGQASPPLVSNGTSVDLADSTSADTTSADTSTGFSSPLHSPRQPAASALATSLAEFRARQHTEPQPSTYYFYQALLHYYLSPLDIRILKAAFGSYSSFPSSILPRVERVSTGHIVDDELRRRIKYLVHLPYGCEVGFLECDWTDTVPPEVLVKFKHEIENRRRRNQDKEAREEKERIRAEKAEDKEFAAARRKRPSLLADGFTKEDWQPLMGEDSAASVDGETASTSPPWDTRPTHSSAYASLASPSTSPT
ncbi:hypothetical protein LTR66_006856, partial [Elasticomyces elasticus]